MENSERSKLFKVKLVKFHHSCEKKGKKKLEKSEGNFFSDFYLSIFLPYFPLNSIQWIAQSKIYMMKVKKKSKSAL